MAKKKRDKNKSISYKCIFQYYKVINKNTLYSKHRTEKQTKVWYGTLPQSDP
jgi:hypothetical protein